MEERYLYIFEDGTVKKGTVPVEEDIDCVIDGILEVIDMDTGQYYDSDSEKWEDLTSATEDS